MEFKAADLACLGWDTFVNFRAPFMEGNYVII